MKPSRAKRPVFLDRDGTLIVEKRYLSDPDQVTLERTVIEGLMLLHEKGHPLIVVSNQSGVGRGQFTEADAYRVNVRTDELLRRHGIEMLAWYICPHAPDIACSCRKPLPGMPFAASQEWGVHLPGSYVIGDKRVDLELADAIGGIGILVTTGHGRGDLPWALTQGRPTFDLFRDAARYICEIEANADPVIVDESATHPQKLE